MRHAADGGACQDVIFFKQGQHLIKNYRAVQISIDNVINGQGLPKNSILRQCGLKVLLNVLR